MKKIIIASLIFFACGTSIPPISYGQVDSLAIKSGQGLFGAKNEVLTDSIIITAFNLGVVASGETINFAFGSVPASATGQILSTLFDVTDTNGEAGITIKFGNKLGLYEIKASAGGDTVIFNLDAFSLKKTILELETELEALTNEGRKLIVRHESGISLRSLTLISGVILPALNVFPTPGQKTTIRSEYRDNLDSRSSKALRIKVLVP